LVKADILARLAVAKNGVELQTLAKKLGSGDLVSLGRELQTLQADGLARFYGGRWTATPKGRRTIDSQAVPSSVLRNLEPSAIRNLRQTELDRRKPLD
jgi:hypothetical protein